MAEKQRATEEWLQRRDRAYDRYRTERAFVKQAVKVAKRMADWRTGRDWGMIFKGNKRMF